MDDNIERQAEELDAALSGRELRAGGASPSDAQLASQVASLAATIRPDPAFAVKLEAQIRATSLVDAQSARVKTPRGREESTRPAGRFLLPRFRWLPLAGFASAAVVVLAILFLWASQPPAANAQEILDKARTVAAMNASGAIQSLELTESDTLRTSTGETVRTTARRWFLTPGQWRAEIQSTTIGKDGVALPDRAQDSVSITDGASVMFLDRQKNLATINPLARNQASTNVSDFGAQPASLQELLSLAAACFNPKVRGTDTLAGRPVYVVDLGVMKCAGSDTAEVGGRATIWVDRETFFTLKHVEYRAGDSTPVATSDVTAIQYNPSLDPALFAMEPPKGATVQDFRPKPAPSADQFQRQLQALAQAASFPLFVPGYVPSNLAPRQPRSAMTDDIQLEYVPSDEVDKPSAAILSGLLIHEQKASYELVTRLTDGAKPTSLSSGQAWLRTDAPNPQGGGMDQGAYVLRDGTLISIASFQVGAPELLKIAASLRAVDGSHAPLPNPTPPALAAARESVSFPVFVPTDVPAGLTPEPPLLAQDPTATVTINYHPEDGRIALTVVNAPGDCCEALAAAKGKDLALATGVTAHIGMDVGDNTGSWTLWWEEDGATIQLSGPDITGDGLVKIANSMSKAAELGETQAPPVRPVPAPLSAPRFTILAPAWLPEEMSKHVALQKSPPEFGSWVVITFLPRGSNSLRTPLLLTEKPGELAAGATQPESTKKIGPYQVSIAQSAAECWNYDWDVGGLHLSLANAFEDSGAARFTCAQMEQIVASIR